VYHPERSYGVVANIQQQWCNQTWASPDIAQASSFAALPSALTPNEIS